MTMSLRRMTLGAGYRYLMSSVARLDEAGPAAGLAAYYAANGTPPGRFLGAGLAGLDGRRGVPAGSVVSEEGLWRMLGMLQDPVTGEPLGALPPAHRTAYVDQTGRVRKPPQTVAGFDLTFSAPKSVSVAWALADDATRGRIYAAHRRALDAVIGYAEQQVFATRLGTGGVVQEDVRGVVAAAFDHWDSRAGDPQLHTHVVVLNRVQAVNDGKWRTLDSKALFRATVGLSELYNGILADQLTADLGWGWTPEQRKRSTEPKWEVTGVPADLRDHFSQRTSAIETAKDDLVEAFTASHGRAPTAREVIQMRQQATLATREAKHVRPLRELIDGWRDRARPFIGNDPDRWAGRLTSSSGPRLLSASDVEDGVLRDLAKLVVGKVADKRATFTRANLLAEALRELHGVRFAAPADRVAVAEQTATYAVDRVVMLTPPDLGHVPPELRRADGSSKFVARNSQVFATQELLDAETRLVDAADDLTAPAAATVEVVRVDGAGVSDEQAAAVAAITGSGLRLDVLVGAAGTGKSTTMAAVRQAWEHTFGLGSVVGLAPSAAAAEVLADAVGVPTENTAKWISEHKRLPDREAALASYAARLARAYPSVATRQLQLQAHAAQLEYERWALEPGQLIIVDEASMAATADLDYITRAAAEAGAKVLLVGDWAQLSPVQAGGAFKLVADHRTDAPQLHDVHRFRHEWERAASLKLRAGRISAADTYAAHGRVESGGREDMLDLIFDGWLTDTQAGRACLMLAADAETVNDLNARARAQRVAAGDVSATGARLGDGTTIGVGDRVVTRLNRRELVTGRGWVKNGDDWIVQAVQDDGSIQVQRAGGGAVALLPPDYVADHVELGYATTAHRAQGRTVDTTHSYVTATTVREPLYVMATRGRESNRLYVDTTYDPDTATSHEEPDQAEPLDVLRSVIETSGADISASETREHERAQTYQSWRLEAQGAAISASAEGLRPSI